MFRLLLIPVIVGVIALAIWRLRTGKLHFRFFSWPLGQQLGMALSALLAVAALLGLAAGQFDFAAWLALISATFAALTLLGWPHQS